MDATIDVLDFSDTFEALVGFKPLPWQYRLYSLFNSGNYPKELEIPTGLGKTAIMAIWLIALANNPDSTPRRFVYVINRRSVVDQTTDELVSYRSKIESGDGILYTLREKLNCLSSFESKNPFVISTLRGKFQDNMEWILDPTRAAAIVGTVDMIGSRLLFSGYNSGYRTKPLHAAFLGQDVLLVHDESHLEPAFQKLIECIKSEQSDKEFKSFRVMSLTATTRAQDSKIFRLNKDDYSNDIINKRLNAKKTILLNESYNKIANDVYDISTRLSGKILIYLDRIDEIDKLLKLLPADKTIQITGTLRGYERDVLVDSDIFKSFLHKDNVEESIYLVCSSAGEIGINISADHLICDIVPMDRIIQRFGRVNRFGDKNDSTINIVYNNEIKSERINKTLDIINQMNGSGSISTIDSLDIDLKISAYSKTPDILNTTSIEFDKWCMTSIKNSPGPKVEPYLHGVSQDDIGEVYVVWRDELDVIPVDVMNVDLAKDILDKYPIKNAEILKDTLPRVYQKLTKLSNQRDNLDKVIWLYDYNEDLQIMKFGELIELGKNQLNYKTVILPPTVGGLSNGILDPTSNKKVKDVADCIDPDNKYKRLRIYSDDPRLETISKDMRLINAINLDEYDDDTYLQWMWFENYKNIDGDASSYSLKAVSLDVHSNDVEKNVDIICHKLNLDSEISDALKFAARYHDCGKSRGLWQRFIGNFSTDVLAKSSSKNYSKIDYRHEFGSLLDVSLNPDINTEFSRFSDNQQDLILHFIAAHHGYGRPHFPEKHCFDPLYSNKEIDVVLKEIPLRFNRLQKTYGRWGLAYLESLLRVSDYNASSNPSRVYENSSKPIKKMENI